MTEFEATRSEGLSLRPEPGSCSKWLRVRANIDQLARSQDTGWHAQSGASTRSFLERLVSHSLGTRLHSLGAASANASSI